MNSFHRNPNPNLTTTLEQAVDKARDRFEVAWREGKRPRIEAYLTDVPETALAAAFRELLDLDLTYRRRAGEQPSPQDYSRRFPEHAELIAKSFGPDMMGATAGSDPDTTVAEPARAGESESILPASPIGRYRVMRPHAKGGLGEVFVAVDQELHREVALKQIRGRHAHDPASRARFVREAEITGGLEHPGVVPVYGLGADNDGRPYYAMRFVRGETLQDAIGRFHGAENPARDPGERALALRGLLRRFIDACNAVAYAHSRGVMHRDIKPANILLGPFGETLLVDWGLAKPVGGPEDVEGEGEAEAALRPFSAGDSDPTQAGSALGTPAYMSPEQAEGAPDRMGPRSDVYSLGATLYVILTGRPPFGGGDLGSVLRRVTNGEFPPPRQVNASVPPALEAVCLKAMALRPEDRYDTSRELADELEHWLADEPVRAWREPWRTRAGRWARRHKPFVAATAVLLVAAVIGLSTGLVLLRAEQRRTESAREEAILNLKAATAAEQAATWARADAEASLARALDAVDTMLVRVSQKHLVNLPHFEPVRRQLLEDALTFYEGFLAREADAPHVLLQAARAYRSAAGIHRQLGQRDIARRELQHTSDLLDRIATNANPEVELERAAVHQGRASIETDERRFPEAIEEFNKAHTLLGRLGSLSLDEKSSRAILTQDAESQSQLGGILTRVNRLADAREAFRLARSSLERLIQINPRDETIRYRLSAVSHNEGLLGVFQDDSAETVNHVTRAIALLDELLKSSPDAVHYRRDLANSSNLVANALGNLGRFTEAIEAGRRSITLFGQLAASYPAVPEHRYHLSAAHHNLGTVFSKMDRLEQARAEYRSAIEAMEVLIRREPRNPTYLRDLANSHMWLGDVERSLGRIHDAVQDATLARDIFAEASRLRPKDPELRFSLAASEHHRANALERTGQLDRAEQGFRASQRILEELLAQYPGSILYIRDLASSSMGLGECLLAEGQRAPGMAELTRALTHWDALVAGSAHETSYLQDRASTLVLLGRFDEAVRAAKALAALAAESGRNHLAAARALAFNLPRSGPDHLAASRVPADRVASLAETATDLLSRGVALGSLTREQLERDDDLASLRRRADYTMLFNRLLDRGFPDDPFAR